MILTNMLCLYICTSETPGLITRLFTALPPPFRYQSFTTTAVCQSLELKGQRVRSIASSLWTHFSRGEYASFVSRNGHIQLINRHRNITIIKALFDFRDRLNHTQFRCKGCNMFIDGYSRSVYMVTVPCSGSFVKSSRPLYKII